MVSKKKKVEFSFYKEENYNYRQVYKCFINF